MKIGDEIYVHGYIDEIRNDVVIIKNDGGYFGTVPSEITAFEQEPVLDKIRAEIEQITDTMGVSYNQYVSKIDVLRILDKYRAESEE